MRGHLENWQVRMPGVRGGFIEPQPKHSTFVWHCALSPWMLLVWVILGFFWQGAERLFALNMFFVLFAIPIGLFHMGVQRLPFNWRIFSLQVAAYVFSAFAAGGVGFVLTTIFGPLNWMD